MVAQHGHVGPDVLIWAGEDILRLRSGQALPLPEQKHRQTKTGVGFPAPVDEMTTFRTYLLSSVPVAPNSLRATVRAGRAMGSAPAAAP